MTSPIFWADDRPAPGDLDGTSLLERAVSYTRGSLQLVASTPLTASTPCRGWNLEVLLRHMNDSLAAFTEAAEIGYVDLVPVRDTGVVGDPSRVLVDRLRGRACALLAAWAHPVTEPMRVADRVLRSDLLASAGSLEIAVHGWDVAQACGVNRPLPPALAADLLDVVPTLVSDDDDRPGRFAHPVDVNAHVPSSSRLLAALGRRSP
jgi:uncharacterized protein (TIGR03086 family)